MEQIKIKEDDYMMTIIGITLLVLGVSLIFKGSEK